MKRRQFTRLTAVVAAVGLVAAIVVWMVYRVPDEPTGGRQVKFRIKWIVYSGFTPHFVALEKGYYERENLRVDIQPGGPGIDPIKLVLAGEADVGLASYDQVLLAREKGLPIVAIGEDTTKSGVGFMALKSSGITRPQDFVGRKVGVMPGTDKGTMYEALMAKVGVDRTKVIEIPVQFNPAVLFNGTVEVFPSFITNQPIQARDSGFEVTVIDPDQYGITPGGNVFFTSETTLREKRDVLAVFIRAELRAIMDSQAMDDGEAVDCVLKHNDQLKRDTEIKIWRATKEMILPKDRRAVGFMSEQKWAHTAEIFRQSGLLREIPDLPRCYTNELVEEAHRGGL
jgi:ABC-type nitrate/sulfonate/bicarbonate transport system substrate-binding protein